MLRWIRSMLLCENDINGKTYQCRGDYYGDSVL